MNDDDRENKESHPKQARIRRVSSVEGRQKYRFPAKQSSPNLNKLDTKVRDNLVLVTRQGKRF